MDCKGSPTIEHGDHNLHMDPASSSISIPSHHSIHTSNCLAGTMKRGRSPPPAKQASPPHRIASPAPESVVLHIDQLTRNVNEAHLKEIFSNFGVVVNVELSVDVAVNIPRGYGYVEFKTRADAEKALLYMDGAQIDGNVV
ncbi:hypothetical protein MRB53_024032 [Persea americana]|uniref:Uncharacterized protein n=1 Tax=Persea americana TaxID=3435 RepID=A0ACC2LB78_PERAE|nr:hypothetical protein MRB53_024032 [Persea americana]